MKQLYLYLSLTFQALVQHSDHEDEEEDDTIDEAIHPAILKQSRQTGSLNLSGRGLSVIPSKVWSLNEDAEKPKGIFMDKVEEDNWWERVDLTKLILASNQISKVSSKIKNLDTLQILDLHDNNISLLPEDMGALEQLTQSNQVERDVKSSYQRCEQIHIKTSFME